MNNTTKLKDLHDLIKFQKKQAYQILAHSHNDDEIKDLCRKFNSCPPKQSKKELDETTFAATAALVLLFSLEKIIPPVNSDYLISSEDMARIAIDAMNVGQLLSEACWQPAEQPAKTRLKQLNNQPTTRKRNNSEEDDLRLMMESYKRSKGDIPKDFKTFRKYLKYEGYEEDRSNKTLYDRDWPWQPSESTVRRWFNKISKELS